MTRKSKLAKVGLAAMVLSLVHQPAFADVKDGVDAWTRGDFENAVKQWREPALKGDADAQFNLGQAYKMGRGVETDLNVALDWYKRAAAQGHLQAADSYGHLLHYQGKINEALPYLQTSAERGDPRGQYLLATELFNGVHIEKDWMRAYALMTRASSAGMAPASRSLAQMDQHIPLEQRQQATVLAGDLEQRAGRARAAQAAGFPINTTPPAKTSKPVTVPLSKTPPATAPGFPVNLPVAPPQPVKSAAAKPAPPKTEAVTTQGKWRIQLGAFGNETNAQKLWTAMEAKMPELARLQPYLKSAGNVTRLQAGPFASRTSADAMCSKVKATDQACIAVSP